MAWGFGYDLAGGLVVERVGAALIGSHFTAKAFRGCTSTTCAGGACVWEGGLAFRYPYDASCGYAKAEAFFVGPQSSVSTYLPAYLPAQICAELLVGSSSNRSSCPGSCCLVRQRGA